MKTQNKFLASILLTAGIISLPVISYAADSKELEDLRAQIKEKIHHRLVDSAQS